MTLKEILDKYFKYSLSYSNQIRVVGAMTGKVLMKGRVSKEKVIDKYGDRESFNIAPIVFSSNSFSNTSCKSLSGLEISISGE